MYRQNLFIRTLTLKGLTSPQGTLQTNHLAGKSACERINTGLAAPQEAN
jgi:hypothetical protein